MNLNDLIGKDVEFLPGVEEFHDCMFSGGMRATISSIEKQETKKPMILFDTGKFKEWNAPLVQGVFSVFFKKDLVAQHFYRSDFNNRFKVISA